MKEKIERLAVEEVEGYAETGAVITLIVGVGVATLLLIFVGVLGGQAWSMVEPDINSINDTTIQQYVKDTAVSGFKALKVTGQYMPMIVLAVVIGLVVSIIVGFTGMGRGEYYQTTAL